MQYYLLPSPLEEKISVVESVNGVLDLERACHPKRFLQICASAAVCVRRAFL